MVDYSCALKFAGSMASLTALREGAQHGFTVKGASCFEEIEKADTIVFDKTGTLTNGEPRVTKVIAFDGWDEDEVLRLSACLEEHFPHPVARAVVKAALDKGLEHRERHAEVEYIVAHGIASALDGKRVIIGSAHFVFGDEGVKINPHKKGGLTRRIGTASPLYLAVDHKLAGVICIEDPLRPGIAEKVVELRELGLSRVVMLTGDNAKTAARIAKAAGIDEFQADMLPEEKHEYLRKLTGEGRRVIMVGDGVNDSPALSLANVGIAMGDGAAIAREVSDVTLSGNDLGAIAQLRRLSCAYSQRMKGSFRSIIGINSALLGLGISGVIAPTLSSLIHNGSTVALSIRNTRPYLG
jgi:P-type E1-E2 ATPase